MDYSVPMRSLLKEVSAYKQYKRLPPVAKVFGFIGVLPFIFDSVLLYFAYNIYLFIFNVLSASVTYLEAWQKKKTEGTGWFAEGIIHLVSLPIIFACHVILSIISISFFLIWFLMQCFLYIATLGGIRWQPYITKANAEDTGDNYVAKTGRTAGTIVAIIFGIISLAAIALYIISYFSYRFAQPARIVDFIYTYAAIITIPLVFRKRVVDNEESVEANDGDEAPELASDNDDDFVLPTL